MEATPKSTQMSLIRRRVFGAGHEGPFCIGSASEIMPSFGKSIRWDVALTSPSRPQPLMRRRPAASRDDLDFGNFVGGMRRATPAAAHAG